MGTIVANIFTLFFSQVHNRARSLDCQVV